MPVRYYSSTAVATTLTGGVSSTATSLTLASTSGFPSSFPFTVILDEGQVNEEIVTVTALSGGQATVIRGEDGTFGASHDAGAVVRHGFSARDLREANEHINATTNIHGVTGSFVGTTSAQTLSSKTMSGNNNTFTDIPTTAVVGLSTAISNASAAKTASDAIKLIVDAATPNITSNALVKRDGSGLFSVSTPQLSAHAASKQYADDMLAAAKTYADNKSGNKTSGGTQSISISNYVGYATVYTGLSSVTGFSAVMYGTSGVLNYTGIRVRQISGGQVDVQAWYFGDLNAMSSPSGTYTFTWTAVGS